MKIKVDVVLKNMNGAALKDIDENGVTIDATLRRTLVNAVLTPIQNESGIEKVKKYELAKRIYTNDEVELTDEEIKLLKNRVGESFGPIVVGQVFEILEKGN